MAKAFRGMALMARYHMEAKDIAPILGTTNAMLWEQHVQTKNIDELLSEFDVSIEAGSARKKLDSDTENMVNAMQILLPVLQGVAMQTGDFSVINQLFADWARVQGLDPARYQIPPIQMQPPPPTEEEGIPPEGAMPPGGQGQEMPMGMPPGGQEMPMPTPEMQLGVVA